MQGNATQRNAMAYPFLHATAWGYCLHRESSYHDFKPLSPPLLADVHRLAVSHCVAVLTFCVAMVILVCPGLVAPLSKLLLHVRTGSCQCRVPAGRHSSQPCCLGGCQRKAGGTSAVRERVDTQGHGTKVGQGRVGWGRVFTGTVSLHHLLIHAERDQKLCRQCSATRL